MNAMGTSTIADNKTTIAGFFERLNQGVLDGSDDWAAYLSPQVIDHNKIIFGEADEPGAATRTRAVKPPFSPRRSR